MRVTNAAELDRRIRAARPGSEMAIVFERRGRRVASTVRLEADPRQALVPAEQAGQALTADQRRFRAAWLGSAAGNVF
jgi:hypothetical protein